LSHVVEVAFESIHMSGPELPEWSQPGVYILKAVGLQSVDAALGIHCGFHETSLAQHAQVL
jgi:hypothetical protein